MHLQMLQVEGVVLMGRCLVCGSETFATDDPRIDICINFRAHGGQYYKLLRKKPREEFPEPELSPEVKETLERACPKRGGCDDG